MFKCCVCHGKTSRRTSQEDDEEDSSEESSTSSSSSSSSSSDSKDEDEEERQIEEELARKFKCQTPPKDELETDKPLEETVQVEVNGDVRVLRDEINKKAIDRDAVKEDVVEILNCAVKIVQEIRRGEREKLEKIKEETETAEESRNVSPAIIDEEVQQKLPPETEALDLKLEKENEPEVPTEMKESEVPIEEESKPQVENEESSLVTVTEEEGTESEILETVKKEADLSEISKTDQIENMIIEELINELNEEADNVQELKEIIETVNDDSQQLSAVHSSNEQITRSNTTTPTLLPSPPPPLPVSTDESSLPSPVPQEDEQEIDNQPPPPAFCEVEIIDEIKKTELHKIELVDVNQSVCPVETQAVGEAIIESGVEEAILESGVEEAILESGVEESILESGVDDLLNIPPPATPPPEEDSDRSNTELSFPTPPPIDFDIVEQPEEEEEEEEEEESSQPSQGPPVPPWDDEETSIPPAPLHQLENLLPLLNRQDSKGASSPGSKSLPSPPSPPSSSSDPGAETEVESKSSSDEQTTTTTAKFTKVVACGSKTAYIERTIDDGPDDEGDDSVFESVSLAKDPETPKDIPPRPVPPVPRWLSQEEDEPENGISEGFGGMQEPPATPVARDELALRRHRFFSDLLQAARSTAEHRVSFDPLGPMVHPGCEHDDREEHLEELVNRLESVTKRLEQVSTHPQQVLSLLPVVRTQEIAVQTKSPSPERSLSLTDELPPEETSQSSSSSRESTVSVASVVEVLKNMSVIGFEDLLAGPVQDYLQLSQKIGGDVAAHSKLVDKAFQIQLQFLKTAASRPAPTNQSEQVSLLGPTSKQIQEIQDFREKHRGSAFFNHLSAISESIPALGWVAVSPTPAPYVKEMNDAGQFYTNRVLKDWKEKDKTHVEWCKAWVKTLTDLQQFVRQHHTTGLVWAKTGSIPAGGVPPPPPPCMMPIADPAPVINDDRSALFAEINQGENITKNLKKVTSDMQTHKNTSLRTGPAPFKAPIVSNNSGSPVKTTLPANAPIDKPPVFTRDGKKWLVEYHKGNKNLVIDNTEMNNVVYMFRCQDSSLVIKGKINSVVMDSCRKSAVVVDSVVASIEFVNCQSVQMQVLGKVPTISIDKTDGCQMYLNKDTLGVELITSKSSEMNVMVPIANNDYTEYPVPEQFKTKITEKGLSTVAVDSLG